MILPMFSDLHNEMKDAENWNLFGICILNIEIYLLLLFGQGVRC